MSTDEETANALKQIQEKMVQSDLESQNDKYSIGLPIPGFEVDVSTSNNNPNSIQTPKPISPKALKSTYQEAQEDEPAEKEVVDKIYRISKREDILNNFVKEAISKIEMNKYFKSDKSLPPFNM